MKAEATLNINDLLKPEDGFTKREDGRYWKPTRNDPYGKILYTIEQALEMTLSELRWFKQQHIKMLKEPMQPITTTPVTHTLALLNLDKTKFYFMFPNGELIEKDAQYGLKGIKREGSRAVLAIVPADSSEEVLSRAVGHMLDPRVDKTHNIIKHSQE